MLEQLRPKTFKRYLSLPLLGTTVEEFDNWLQQLGYPIRTRRYHITQTATIDDYFQKRDKDSVDKLTWEDWERCWNWYRQLNSQTTYSVRILRKFFEFKNILHQHVSMPTCGPFSLELDGYAAYLRDVRGITCQTTRQHLLTASQFLQHLMENRRSFRLGDITAGNIESFVTRVGKRFNRGTLQHVIARLRSFLRYLAMEGKVSVGLDSQIDTPRVYRMEQLPRALPWETVGAFLNSIDQQNPVGLRDYTIFFLISSYGMRSCEIVDLTLDDIQWRKAELLVPQRKTGHPLILPLTDRVGSVLLRYLRKGRPHLPFRELFLRARAPAGSLKPTAVSEAFQKWSKRSGLYIPFQGPHCLRHSYAIHLLHQGVSMKSIGDLLGHRSAESTCVYLRFATEELREVTLPLPASSDVYDELEV